MADFFGGIGQGIASVIGSGLDFLGQERANRQNRDIWKKTQDWTDMMSNTAWQRGVKDMKAAGINPMVSFSQGGASSPSGTIGSAMQNPAAGMKHSAIAAGRSVAEVLNLRKQNAKIDAETALAKEQANLTRNAARKTAVDTVATEGTLKHLLGTIWDEGKSRLKGFSFKVPTSARSLNLSKGLFGK